MNYSRSQRVLEDTIQMLKVHPQVGPIWCQLTGLGLSGAAQLSKHGPRLAPEISAVGG